MKTFEMDLSPDGRGKLTAYLLGKSPELTNADVRPAIIIFPGGGYQRCSDREAEPVAMSFAAQGFHAFVLRYSVKEHAAFPQPLLDAEGALRAVRANAREWGVDPGKIAVCGFSAGGHLAASLATMENCVPMPWCWATRILSATEEVVRWANFHPARNM